MTEDQARAWVRDRFGVSRETRLDHLVSLVRAENLQQNLIAPSTIDHLWSRHVVDSAQLLPLASDGDGKWLDIGTGAGFPGLVVACLREQPIVLCEPRRRRSAFLADAAGQLGLSAHVRVASCRIEALRDDFFSIVSARAVAPLPELFAAAHHLTDRRTLWLLPKGKTAREEVVVARKTWHGRFHVEHSITQSDSLIVVARGLARK